MEKSTVSINQLANNIPSVNDQNTTVRQPSYRRESVFETVNRSLKKVLRIGKEVAPKVVIQLVRELKDIMPIGEICLHLGVGRSSYYRWRKNADLLTQKEIRDQQSAALCKQHKKRLPK